MKINWKMLGTLAVAGLVLYFVIGTPERAADTVQNGLHALGNGADRIGMFLTQVFK